jgi:hypothetical protein
MMTTKYLIVRADGTVRVTTRWPNLRVDEVAYRLRIEIPVAWGKVAGNIDITMPPPPGAEVEL